MKTTKWFGLFPVEQINIYKKAKRKVEKILKSKKNSLNEEDSYNNDSYSFTGLNNEEIKETEE